MYVTACLTLKPFVAAFGKIQMSIQQDWQDQEPRKRGMGSGSKVLLILGGVGGLFLLLCCGGGAYLFWQARNALENLVTTDPAAIKTKTQSIAKIDVLPGFKPVQAMDMIVMKWVVYQGEAGDDSMLMLMEFQNSMFQGANKQEQKDQMLQQMRQQQQAQGGNTNIQAEETTKRDFTIGGRKNEFTFVKGKSQQGKAVRQVTGTFPTVGGVAMLMLIIPDEKYDEAAVIRMLESIRTDAIASDVEDDDAMDNAEAESNEAAGSTIPLDQPDQSGTKTPEDDGEPEAEPNS